MEDSGRAVPVILGSPDDRLRDALAFALTVEGAVEIVGVAATTEDTLPLCQRAGPVVVIVEHHPPYLDAVQCARHVAEMGLPARVILIDGQERLNPPPEITVIAAVVGRYLSMPRLVETIQALGRELESWQRARGDGDTS
jgi:DNA-binding NarL/FixJ family response regulator